jgi:hypothetical protein
MKYYCLTILLISSLLIGCSGTYSVSNFQSKAAFYNKFNNFANDKNLNVTLINGSTFAVKNGVQIVNDTLC